MVERAKPITGTPKHTRIRFGSISDIEKMRRAARILGISRNRFMVEAILAKSAQIIEAHTASDRTETLLEKGA